MIQEELDKIKIGSVVAEMHLHQVTSGQLEGWDVNQVFEIPQHAAFGLAMGLNWEIEYVLIEKSTPSRWASFTDKMAIAVSVTDDNIKQIPTVLVVYRYEDRFYMTTLTNHLA